MFFGATSPARNSRPQIVDLNLVPPEYRPRPFPIVSAGLGLLLAGCALLLYATFYAKTYTDLEINRLTSRVSQAETVVKSATGDPAALARQDQLRAMRNDYDVLAQREINWGDVFQTIGDTPPGVAVKSVGQSGFGVTVTGSASNAATAALYLDKLRASNLFVDAALQVSPSTAVANESPTVTAQPTQPVATLAAPAPAAVAPAPPVQPPLAPRPTSPANQPLAAPAPAFSPTKTATPTITRTPTITQTPTPSPTSTPAFDFVLVSTQQIPTSNPMAGNSDIRGTVVDPSNNPVSGLVVEIDSEGEPPWSVQKTTDGSGSFDFNVSHGKFKVFVAEGSSQPAMDLYTGADGVPGTYGYQLSFQQTFVGSAPPGGFGSPTPTYTGSATATPSDTPISLGLNVASYGCATAYFQNNPASLVGNDPGAAIDGNLGTEWNAGTWTQNGNPLIWQWSLPRSPMKCTDGRTAGGLSDTQDQIEGFQLIPDQNPSGTTIHELWLYSDPACTTNIHTDNSVYFTWDGDTSAGQILPLKISPVLVRCVIVRTLADPSFVAWQEVQIYQTVAPPSGFLTLTPSPTATVTGTPPTATNTPLMSSTPTISVTSTPSLTPTSSGTPTPTSTQLSQPPGSQNISPEIGSVTVYGASVGTSCPQPGPSGPQSPCNATDGSIQDFWAPASGSGSTQGITAQLASSAYVQGQGNDSVVDAQLTMFSPANGLSVAYQITLYDGLANPTCTFSAPGGYPDYFQVSFASACPTLVSTSTPVYALWVTVLITQDGSQPVLYGLRELSVFKKVQQPTPAPTATATIPQTPTSAPTPSMTFTSIPTPTVALTPTITLTPSVTQTVTSTLTATRTSSPSNTPTAHAAPIKGPSQIALTATRTPSASVVAGIGLGPGDETRNAPNLQSNGNTQSAIIPSPLATPAPVQGGEAVDFTIVLEVASGAGYP
jgi:hypothetical protein